MLILSSRANTLPICRNDEQRRYVMTAFVPQQYNITFYA